MWAKLLSHATVNHTTLPPSPTTHRMSFHSWNSSSALLENYLRCCNVCDWINDICCRINEQQQQLKKRTDIYICERERVITDSIQTRDMSIEIVYVCVFVCECENGCFYPVWIQTSERKKKTTYNWASLLCALHADAICHFFSITSGWEEKMTKILMENIGPHRILYANDVTYFFFYFQSMHLLSHWNANKTKSEIQNAKKTVYAFDCSLMVNGSGSSWNFRHICECEQNIWLIFSNRKFTP